MLELTPEQISLNATPKDKNEAMSLMGELLIRNGNIDPRYVDSMFAREAVANTYLANGIVIPHGLPEDRDWVLKTGIVVLQIPKGVAWNDEETAHILVGIAAKSDEHLGILRKLTRVVGNEDEALRLANTTDKTDIILALTGEKPISQNTEVLVDFADYFDAQIINPTGLHARPATELVSIAKSFESQVRVRYGEAVTDAKSLVNLLQLGVVHGATVRVSAQGADVQAALESLKNAIESGLGETTHDEGAPKLNREQLKWNAISTAVFAQGVAASDGIVHGALRQHKAYKIHVQDTVSDPEMELNHFEQALARALQALHHNYEEVKTRLGSQQASIFLAHAEFAQDAELLNATRALIHDKHSAAWAWQQVIEQKIAQLNQLDDPVLAGRAMDLSDVGQRVLRELTGVEAVVVTDMHTPSILIADDLTPSDTANLDPDMILGFITAKGGPTSHSAIIARAMGIPAIVAAGDEILKIANDTPCILDGFNGALYLNPTADELVSAQALHDEVARQLNVDFALRMDSAHTTDGHSIEVFANVNRVADAVQAVEYGAEGVGLMRTEFLFLDSDETPSEQAQFEIYRDMALALKGRPLTIRTLDIGGDKQVPHLNLPKEDNSFLGIRGIRLCLARPDLFEPQLRAIYRASLAVQGQATIRVMFPMISTIDDIDQTLAICERIRIEVNAPKIEIGIMVEVPSTAIMAEQFAKRVDFFSIGTNDLTQYTLAMDRVHPQLAKQADALNPAVLRLINMTVQAAQREGKWVGVCGGVASDIRGASILVGLGVSELSITVPTIPTIKAHLRQSSLSQMQALAQQALVCRTAGEVRAL
ncbi:MAG: phosphoenolpyruvate-protein phosphotransferase [Burkholderiaceae bacterium]|nr:phosphoenolpyruvate-protein phosphotransferase [Burkholderiaceae bacterium]